MNFEKYKWLWIMAWRDSRRSRSRLVLFTSSIVLGVAALVAINSFEDNLREEIQGEARELLGADLMINNNQPFSDSAQVFMDSLGGEQANELFFASMVYFPKSQGTRLVQVRVLEGKYPFYGEIETLPTSVSRTFLQGQYALVDQTLMLQYNAEIGDSVKVGNLMFEIAGKLLRVPGQSGITATVAAPVYIPMQYLDQTGLVQKGSRINYQRYYKFDDNRDVEKMMEGFEARMRTLNLRYDTVEEKKRDTSRAFSNLSEFLNLVGFVALLLGCVGVASAVHIYTREKIDTVAVLRCLGATGRQAFMIFLIQIGGMGFLGSVAGAILGSQIQTILPAVLRDFLPFEANFGVSFEAIFEGIGVGVIISLLFAMLPLLAVRRISPLSAIRASFESENTRRDYLQWAISGLIGLFIFGFAYLQMGSWRNALIFSLSLLGAFLLLTGLAWLTMWLVRKYFPSRWNYLWRQSLANLYRPNNMTLTLIVSIGLGTGLISTLYFVQGLLVETVAISDKGDLPNMVLFDIQTTQKTQIADLTRSYGFPVLQEVPIITMRLDSLKGRSREELLADTAQGVSGWTLNREYRVTFRDTLIDTEKIVAGEWSGKAGETIYVSLEEGFAKEAMQLELGDELVFDVQGVPIKTVVGSFRKVDFQRVQTNFLVVFPTGVLEDAPQFHVLITKVGSQESSAKFQQQIAREYPNISLVDLGLILSTVEEVLDKVSFVIQFMAMFSIFTGLIVLIGSVIISKYQRIQESVLLRTLGASRRQILIINALEYMILGGLASFSGIILALLSTWGLAVFTFETAFVPDFVPALVVFGFITGMTVLIGLTNSRSVLNNPPLEILRKEG
ncbi:MAG: FtsX-like permease family protein [Bacteroidia bacterium]|nr:FtsX-like permease family protein [Bacteroidia bacterium]